MASTMLLPILVLVPVPVPVPVVVVLSFNLRATETGIIEPAEEKVTQQSFGRRRRRL